MQSGWGPRRRARAHRGWACPPLRAALQTAREQGSADRRLALLAPRRRPWQLRLRPVGRLTGCATRLQAGGGQGGAARQASGNTWLRRVREQGPGALAASGGTPRQAASQAPSHTSTHNPTALSHSPNFLRDSILRTSSCAAASRAAAWPALRFLLTTTAAPAAHARAAAQPTEMPTIMPTFVLDPSSSGAAALVVTSAGGG